MITAGDFKKGITVEWDGGVWTIVDFQHVKPGKGAAFVRTKIKNVMTGAVVERSFNPTDKMPKAIIETKEMQYVYNDGELYYFMDVETYDQIPMSLDKVEDAIPEMNALLQRILPLRPLRDCGFTEADFKIFPQSVETNQQRLMTNAYYPFDLESEEAIYRKCY